MASQREDLEVEFQGLSDEELVRRYALGGLTEIGQEIAINEARSRKLSLPNPQSIDEEEMAYNDMEIVARDLTPTEAHMLCSRLNSCDIPASAGDVNLVQAYSLISIAVGGACVRVPPDFVDAAMEVITAFKQGAFELGDDFHEEP